MKKAFLFIAIAAMAPGAFAQTKESVYPKTLFSPNDSFSVRFSNNTDRHPVRISEADSSNMGTNGSRGLAAIIYYGKDSLRIPYTNLPYGQYLYIPFRSPKGKTVYLLHFNSTSVSFSKQYMKEHAGTATVEIPEVYELANIIWSLSPTGKRAKDLNNTGAYYDKVAAYFKPYMDHPLFKKLDFPDSVYSEKYYDLRENSFTYSFGKDTRLHYDGPYYYVTGHDWENFNSLFKQLLPLIEDFARRSNFRKFYKDNSAYYAGLIRREAELMPVKKMWRWLEAEFPDSKYDAYKVIFSPLISGSHSTQNYWGYKGGTDFFREAVMFVCGPDRYDNDGYTEQQKEGLISGIVFTEIDHNYVNPVSKKYRKTIDSICSNRDLWTVTGKGADHYSNAQSVFNEYMTHAAFCLYIADTYDKETADLVIGKREELMVDKRGFIQFKGFNRELMDLHQKNKGKKTAELYPEILAWCRTVKG